jgi:hypothetical protein
MAREILSKRNFLDFESPDSAISRSPMTLMNINYCNGSSVENLIEILLDVDNLLKIKSDKKIRDLAIFW